MSEMKSLMISCSDRVEREFFYRDTFADRGVLEQVFRNRDYSTQKLAKNPQIWNAFCRIRSEGKTPLIVDLGANIGASALWFATEFSGSHVVAVEPEESNCVLLRRNLSTLNVDIREAAIGARDGRVKITNPDSTAWAYRTAEAAGGPYQMVSMSRLVGEKIAQGYVPFLVKIDIEGGERDLFESLTDWIDQFSLLIIELHDWLYPGEGNSGTFLRAIGRYDRDFVYFGENIFSIRNEG